ncbi:hypothetical protein [Limosilactobacillus equigenerosi]|uniref:Uncharacterized protein n=1 Tax=Limosilactobacillus equigenerosi DSM 18793 = JCM 14505 TaxID=1423742 RepID=A0A0R1URS7_9LACO|nr:hypothetical protein [Limosilactobacillus equigenerosi]KRL92603.1 hypothetical protein FC21_GL000196 [Limosilactobacillus equigenerosi DSM 18793 = JCM 14505]
MMKRKILIILLFIGGIVGYVHYNLEHYFFYYITTYDVRHGTFNYLRGLGGFNEVRLQGYHIESRNELLGETDNYIYVRNVIKAGDLAVLEPVDVNYYPNEKEGGNYYIEFNDTGRAEKGEKLHPKLKQLLVKVRDDFRRADQPKINLQWIFTSVYWWMLKS